MTALTEYQRLEAQAVWRPAPDAQRRDVVVSVGEATLVMTDHKDTALAHWSLAAVERRNPGQRPAVFAPGPDATEELEIADGEMIDAIERVRRAVDRARPRPGRLRRRIALSLALAVVTVGLIWVPDALIRNAARVAPEASRAEIGAALLGHVARMTGTPCRSPAGDRALARMMTRLGGTGQARIVVVRDGLSEAAHLPGGIVLLGRSVVEDHESPEVAAGYVLAELSAARMVDPLLALLDRAGPVAAFTLLTTGHLPDGVLAEQAEFLLTSRDAGVPDDVLIAAFDAAGLRTTPYAYARDISGEDTIRLIEADPVEAETARSVLSDGDWVALQGICGS